MRRRITISIYDPRGGDQDNLLTVEIFPDMTISTLRESIEDDTKIPSATQSIYHNGRLVSDDSKTMEQLEIKDGDMLAMHVRAAPASAENAPRPTTQQVDRPRPATTNDPETIRLQILGNPNLREQISPELANAVDDPVRFAEAVRAISDREQRERRDRQREIARLNDDPFDIENQRKIEEMIRQEQVMENLQNAMEHNPEVFGRVHMLYVNVEVNGHKVKAFVDSGAQATIMSPSCAETCGIMRLVDNRFSGVAKGVGTAKILGRVHSAQIKIGSQHLACSFTVMEGKDIDMLLGLDMLKRHQATIDLGQDQLIIHGEKIPFLGEADIPKEKGLEEPTVAGPSGTTIGQNTGAVEVPRAPSPVQQPPPAQAAQTSTSAPSTNDSISEDHINTLMGMGASREQAIQALQAADGNVDVAAGIIFF